MGCLPNAAACGKIASRGPSTLDGIEIVRFCAFTSTGLSELRRTAHRLITTPCKCLLWKRVEDLKHMRGCFSRSYYFSNAPQRTGT